jgi:DNA (cytosine-5)-methyltransferase 1
MTKMKIGSLFSGYGGLDMAVANVFDAEVAWHCEWEDAPAKILENNFPGVPNFRDVSQVDWTQVEPVDILTGGFPCQDVSLAGTRKGLTSETRSGLWSEFAKAIEILKPRLVVIENVRGLLSANADGKMEHCSWCLGDNPNEPSLRALGAVLGDLADIGFDAEWTGVRAADVGAPHARFRIFIVAYPATPPGQLKTNLPTPTVSDLYSDSLKSSQQSVGSMHSVTLAQAVTRQDLIHVPDSSLLRTPSAIEGEGGAMRADVKRERGRMLMVRDQMAQLAADNGLPVNDSLLPTPNTMEHREIKTPEQIAEMRERSPGGYRNLREVVINEIGDGKLLPTVTTQDGKNNGAESQMRRNTKPLNAEVMDETNWGQFEPAIRRWETILNRQAPPPTEATGKDGNHRLSSKFTEWMMGLPDGHVTSPEIGITRNDQLKACGNGVVPQQAEFALQTLLTRIPRKVTK